MQDFITFVAVLGWIMISVFVVNFAILREATSPRGKKLVGDILECFGLEYLLEPSEGDKLEIEQDRITRNRYHAACLWRITRILITIFLAMAGWSSFLSWLDKSFNPTVFLVGLMAFLAAYRLTRLIYQARMWWIDRDEQYTIDALGYSVASPFFDQDSDLDLGF